MNAAMNRRQSNVLCWLVVMAEDSDERMGEWVFGRSFIFDELVIIIATSWEVLAEDLDLVFLSSRGMLYSYCIFHLKLIEPALQRTFDLNC